MGADMTIATLTIPLDECEGPKEAYENYKHKIIDQVMRMSDDQLSGVWEDAGREIDDIQELKGVLESAAAGASQLQLKTIEVINELQPDMDREVTYLDHKGDRIYITGGMSWGDDPSDCYWQIVLVSDLVWHLRQKHETNVRF